MGYQLAIDFGTTNTVIAQWNAQTNAAEIVAVPGIGGPALADRPSLVPSLVYINEGKTGVVTIGQRVIDQHLERQQGNRLFRNFKRGIVATPSPDPREIDGAQWADRDAGRAFVRGVIDAMPFDKSQVEQLVLTAPVASFEGYLTWLNSVMNDLAQDRIRIVDESTAAALGYTVTKPGAVVLVFDFGGGTLDLSLVQLPESRDKTGGFIKRLLSSNSRSYTARVIAKAGRMMGGSDIDQWLLADVLKRTGVSTESLGNHYALLLAACEQAKIALSTAESAEIHFEAGDKKHSVTITREQMEALLEENGFYTALRRVVDKVMHVARQRGIFEEDIHYVLMVGGTSLMPSVQRTLGKYFTDMAVHSDKPFTAVAEGALQVAAGFGLEDYLVHSYGLRYLDPQTGTHQYDEIIPLGSSFPTETPIEIMLEAAHDQQKEVEFVIGEIDTDSVSMIEVKYENGQAVFVAQTNAAGRQIVPLNEAESLSMLAKLTPPGKPGENRLKAQFMIDDKRMLRLTVIDVKSNKPLLNDVAVVTLR